MGRVIAIQAPEIKGDGRSPVEGQPPTFGRIGDGCRYSKSCLTCPLEFCKYDRKPPDSDARKAQALKLFDAGMLASEVAVVVSCRERTVHRWASRRRTRAPFELTAKW